MPTERLWRAAAITLCAAVPASFYVIGDLTDAFPGVLTVVSEETGPAAGPRAQAEDYDRVTPEAPGPPVAASVPTEQARDLQARMDAHASLPVVAGNLSYAVVDADSGEQLASRDAHTAHVPASTLKLLTAAAVLRLYDGDVVLTTRAVVQDGTVTLQGGGDMMLSEDDLRELASAAADLAREQGTTTVTVAVDTGFLTGGANPAWGNNGPAGGWVTPTAALAVDRGWLDGNQYGPKSTDPAGDAARLFVTLLTESGLEVTGEPTPGATPDGAPSVAVDSEPIVDIVRHTLLISDNTTAELLAHLVARQRGEQTTPEGAAAAVEAEIRELGAELGLPQADLDALHILDGSGLSPENRVPPALLAAVMGEVGSGNVQGLEQILFDVPVAGLSGTLADRFDADGTRDARGIVRGKTGYLGGAATLAGVAVLPGGRTVGYSIVVHGFEGVNAVQARAAVDAVAAELVQED
ncbi:D-alanyl-D-alanine carboxypeptidase [Brachybacterium muris]|uniref:D-alanyl-D-alanine carboxypeptidase n=1 Tax=Brachybacterium muris TaxID=219301 RepID=UPI0019598BA3|nr:D-alanyl-D-alanine carboxypeptidase [Brachybacterium muris]MBM7500219.1 D-alanyl-D-alanine carboxypeptidase/D-alanyl-D-alanine-endopeptidase (penicillin-binding protein 4) [Brachybacterium muris]MCT1429252.1 D-alanyl-D-alanine carboxypeptidase [Brachybacterium muris]MCT1999078.1 D-alanyl-D-alanine carboxypeptidase [Brachybacterium muris]MCT2176255.1 D-alanyl-D-alanine carboxypeptidase [Brachybacterium muris]MCT2260495.1 D-alanyl-D-alanine carboxypeptidase [Brachybacterium muris]